MKDDPNFNIKFVSIVEKYTVLYNHTLDGYSNRQIQEKTWNEVGNEINDTGAACKEKWKNIRSAFSRHLRHKTSLGTPGTIKKNYYLSEYLHFLLPFTKSRARETNIPIAQATNDEINDYDEDESCGVTSDNVGEVKKEIETDDGYFITTDGTYKYDSQTNENQPNAKLAKKQFEPIEKYEIDYSHPKKISRHDENDDADLYFLKSLLPDLRNMNDQQKYEFKLKTIQTIGDILYRQPFTYNKADQTKEFNRAHRHLNSEETSTHASSSFASPTKVPLISTEFNEYNHI